MARLLVVDDSMELLAALGPALSSRGHAVTVTQSGADALCLLAHKPPPDLLLLDMVMPGLDGHAILKELGPTAPPVILMTADGPSPEECQRVSRVLVKPFDWPDLLAVIADVLDGAAGGRFAPDPPPGLEPKAGGCS